MADSEHQDPAPSQKRRRLTLKQQAFISNYTDPSKPTFGNGTQSVIAVPGRRGTSYQGAAVMANEYLSNPKLISEIERSAHQAGLTDMFRFRALKDIAAGQYVTTEITERLVKGKLKKITTTRTPKAAEIVKAIDTVNKMSGLYEKNRVMANATSQRFRELARQYQPKLVGKGKGKRVGVDVYESIQVQVEPDISLGFMPCDSEPTDNEQALAYEA